MEPGSAIAVIETELRSMVRDIGRVDWRATLGPERVGLLQTRFEDEVRRRSPIHPPTDLLEYTHFYELRTVITKNWQVFATTLGKKRDFETWADHVEDFRNAPSHGRELQPFERALLEGIAGLVRTRVTAARSDRGPDSKHYPLIESVEDSFGNRVGGSNDSYAETDVVLEPGQKVTFRARGVDPQGRDLEWSIAITQQLGAWVATGSEATLTWDVADNDVAGHCYVNISLRSSGKYHRHTRYDDGVVFVYRVDPPSGHQD